MKHHRFYYKAVVFFCRNQPRPWLI